MMMAFLKSTVLPRHRELTVLKHCSRMLNRSGCAFPFVEERRVRRAFDAFRELTALFVATYPGGEPISLDTECFSMNSDM